MTRRPEPVPEIESARAELERQDRAVDDLARAHGEHLGVRPESGRWSVAEHLLHLSLLNGPYLRVMKAAAREGREQGVTGRGPFRDPLVGRLFIWFMEPPPKIRVRTLRATRPDPTMVDPAEALRDFERAQAAFRVLLDEIEGLDLVRVRFESPFARLLSLTLDQGIRLLLAHNRRHLWLAREALGEAQVPPGSERERTG
jgi:hypothetical protein